MLGLSVNATKTEATWLEVGAREKPPLTEKEVLVGGVHVAIGPHMKYLGVELEQRGIYHHHFRLLAPKLDSTEAALSRLLPNLHGPGLHLDGPRRLYADVLGSMALYGAPEWVVRANGNRIRQCLDSVQRANFRCIRGYRTISTVVAGVLAGSLPLDLTTVERKRAFDLRCGTGRTQRYQRKWKKEERKASETERYANGR